MESEQIFSGVLSAAIEMCHFTDEVGNHLIVSLHGGFLSAPQR